MSRRALIVRFTLLEIFFWCSIASFSAFAIAYLQSARGVSDGQAGVMIMLMTASAFAGQFVWGGLCDRLGTHKWMFVAAGALQGPLCLAVFFAGSYPLMCVFYGLLGFVQSAMPANVDTWILKSFPETPALFGPIRSAGSLAYAVFALFFGRVIAAVGYAAMPVAVAFFILSGAAVALLTPDIKSGAGGQVDTLTGARALFKGKFLVLLLVLLLTGVCATTFQFFTMMMNRAGGSVSLLGVAMFASAIAQVPLMFYGRYFARFPVKARVAVACGLYTVMGLFFAFATRPAHIVVGALFSGVGYGIFLPAVREWVFGLSTPETRTTAQGMADAVYMSLGGMISSGAVGALADSVGLSPLLLAFVGAQALGILLLLLGMRERERGRDAGGAAPGPLA